MKETNTYKKLKNKSQDNFPNKIIVHHSAASENQTIESIENYHLSLGWEGIGYQYLISKNGDIYKGRPEIYHGSHCIGHNQDSIGICLIGNFDLILPSTKQKVSLTKLLIDISSRYKIEEIVPHRKYTDKSCYGKLLSDTWAKELIENQDKIKIKKQIIKLLEQL